MPKDKRRNKRSSSSHECLSSKERKFDSLEELFQAFGDETIGKTWSSQRVEKWADEIGGPTNDSERERLKNVLRRIRNRESAANSRVRRAELLSDAQKRAKKAEKLAASKSAEVERLTAANNRLRKRITAIRLIVEENLAGGVALICETEESSEAEVDEDRHQASPQTTDDAPSDASYEPEPRVQEDAAIPDTPMFADAYASEVASSPVGSSPLAVSSSEDAPEEEEDFVAGNWVDEALENAFA